MASQAKKTEPEAQAAGSLGPLELAIVELRDRLESQLDRIATIAGSYLRGYIRNGGLLVVSIWRVAFRVWLVLVLPYSAWGAVGEYLLARFPFYTALGVVGIVLLVGPPAALALTVYVTFNKTRSPDNVVPFPRSRWLKKEMLVVPLSRDGHRYWLFGVVGGAAVLTVAFEVGWIAGLEPLVDVHNTVLAWPNVWPLDLLVNALRVLTGTVGFNW